MTTEYCEKMIIVNGEIIGQHNVSNLTNDKNSKYSIEYEQDNLVIYNKKDAPSSIKTLIIYNSIDYNSATFTYYTNLK